MRLSADHRPVTNQMLKSMISFESEQDLPKIGLCGCMDYLIFIYRSTVEMSHLV